MRNTIVTLGKWTRRAGWVGGLLALLLLGSDLFAESAASPVSEASSLAVARPVSETSSFVATTFRAEPAAEFATRSQRQTQSIPTYVSELAPAVMQAPREPAALPASGAPSDSRLSWPKPTGLLLALLGALLIYRALTLRTGDTD